jgi:hypothetical protein
MLFSATSLKPWKRSKIKLCRYIEKLQSPVLHKKPEVLVPSQTLKKVNFYSPVQKHKYGEAPQETSECTLGTNMKQGTKRKKLNSARVRGTPKNVFTKPLMLSLFSNAKNVYVLFTKHTSVTLLTRSPTQHRQHKVMFIYRRARGPHLSA